MNLVRVFFAPDKQPVPGTHESALRIKKTDYSKCSYGAPKQRQKPSVALPDDLAVKMNTILRGAKVRDVRDDMLLLMQEVLQRSDEVRQLDAEPKAQTPQLRLVA